MHVSITKTKTRTRTKKKNREHNQIMTNNTKKITSKNQRDDCTPLVVDHGNTTKEEVVTMEMIITTTMIHISITKSSIMIEIDKTAIAAMI